VHTIVLSRPSTRLGWWLVGLAAAFVMLFVINAALFLPAPGAVPWREAMVGIGLQWCGICSGAVALLAVNS
jgi:hypothetical protein